MCQRYTLRLFLPIYSSVSDIGKESLLIDGYIKKRIISSKYIIRNKSDNMVWVVLAISKNGRYDRANRTHGF